jgi:hypothetical protein
LPLAYKNNQYDALEFENNSFQYVRFEKQLTIDKEIMLLVLVYSLVYSARKNPAF